MVWTMTDQSSPGSDDERPYPHAPLNDGAAPPHSEGSGSSGSSHGWRRARPLEHPENDLSDDADFSNLQPPPPGSFDDFVNQEDPLVLAERNRRSSKQAIRYLIAALVTTFLFGFVMLLIMRLHAGGDTCTAVEGRFLCTFAHQKAWAVIVSLPPIAFLVGSMFIMVRKLRSYVRWRPWMGVFWVLVPFTMWVLTVTVQVYLAKGFAL